MEETNLVLAAADDAEVIHQMKYKAFLPLYEKYYDDDTNPPIITQAELLCGMEDM